MLLVDKYRPTHLKDIINTQELQNIDKQDIPHLLFYGTLGVGKMTRINALLTEIYGSFKLSIQSRTFQTASNKQIQISVASSIHHIQVTPSDVGIYDKLVIQDLIKDLAQSKNINGMFKVVVINEAHLLSVDAQHALRRTMEVYMANLRLFLCCNGIGKIIGPLRSRCLLIRVPSPSIDQITTILNQVSLSENINLPSEFALKIATSSKGNLRRALLTLEAAKVTQYPFIPDQSISVPDWELCIQDITFSMIQEQSPARLLQVRAKLYELIAHCIPADVILKNLVVGLLKMVDVGIKRDILKIASEYDFRLRVGVKSIFHLEAFVAKFFSVYKRYLNDVCDF